MCDRVLAIRCHCVRHRLTGLTSVGFCRSPGAFAKLFPAALLAPAFTLATPHWKLSHSRSQHCCAYRTLPRVPEMQQAHSTHQSPAVATKQAVRYRAAHSTFSQPAQRTAAPRAHGRRCKAQGTRSRRALSVLVMAATEAPSQTAPAPAADAPQKAARRVTYTSYEVNTWQATFEQSGVTVLVDPWLVGDLTFAKQSWLYSGQKVRTRDVDAPAVAHRSDVMLITQGLDDHCHMPTLEQLPRDIPVVAQATAAAACRQLGYTDVTELDHGQTVSVAGGKLELTGTAGALVGPPWSKRQLGVVFRETEPGGVSLYYEPHCDADLASVAAEAAPHSIDIVVTPVVNQELIAYPLVYGDDNVVALLQQLKPSVIIPFMNAEMQASGPLSLLIRQKGSLPEFERKLQDAGLSDVRIQPVAPPPTPMTVEV